MENIGGRGRHLCFLFIRPAISLQYFSDHVVKRNELK